MKVFSRNFILRFARNFSVLFVIAMLALGSSGFLFIKNAPEAKAATNFTIQTGYYLGTGASSSITGLGFSPQLLIIKSETAAGFAVVKSSSMAASEYAYLGAANANNVESQISLDADGFTVQKQGDVNTNGVRYIWIAFANSDCTSNGTFCVGSYTGTGSIQSVSTGFQPDLIWIKRTTATAATLRTSVMATTTVSFLNAVADDSTGLVSGISSTGFSVSSTNVTSGGLYYYFAFKNLSNMLTVGDYTGNGVDNTDITAPGFQPNFVITDPANAVQAAMNVTQSFGDFSSFAGAATAAATTHIKSLISTGFRLGVGTSANASGIVNHYIAFGGAAAPSFSGTYFMARGQYVGNGAVRSINTLSFAPDLVIIKGDTGQYGVFSTSLDVNLTHYFANAIADFVNGITSLDSAGFSLGTDPTVNQNNITYNYIAFGNATSPQHGARASDFFVGAYTGNALSRSIGGLGIQPNMVVVKGNRASAAQWRSSTIANNNAAFFGAAANDGTATIFTTLDSGGFSVGTNNAINAANIVNTFFGFKNGSTFTVNSYVGNGTNLNVSSTGFQPDYVWTKASSAVAAVHRSSDPSLVNTLNFTNAVNVSTTIDGFLSNGFSVSSTANTNALTYFYAAWKMPTTTGTPNTPTNSSPANAAVAQNLNTTLVASAYSDPASLSQTLADWQVDDDSDFSSPVWTRTSGSAEITTDVSTSSGTFANELAGKTSLDHNTTYYWRVRYSNGAYSFWSTATSFTTNAIDTPTNVSPSDGGIATTLTPVLSASSFSDPQSGHIGTYAQWQINTADSFSSPIYDSGQVAYNTTSAVPAARLSNNTTYYWRVRYADADGQWSAYSSSTRFLVSQSEVTVRPLFGTTVVDQGDSINIDAQIKLADGTAINDASASISIYNAAGVKVVDSAAMAYVSSSIGIYRYPFSVPSSSGSYLYVVSATATDGRSGTGADSFEVRTISADITAVKNNVATLITEIGTGNIAAIKTKTDTISWADITGIVTDTGAIKAKTDTIDWTHVSAIKTKTDTISWSDIVGIDAKVTTTQSNVDILLGAIIVTQSTVNDAAATTSSFITNLANATDNFYKNAVITFTSGTLQGQSRRISAYNGSTKQLTLDPSLTSAPSNGDAFTITTQNVRVEEQVAEHEASDAVFRASTTARLASIESKIDSIISTLDTVDANLIDVQSTVDAIRASQLAGSPAEVVINEVTGLTVPNIAANITITNEGDSPYEYQYSWCVVTSQTDSCGAGNNNVYYAAAAKRLIPGESFNPTLTATVPQSGNYWFKVVVHFGITSSSAVRQFTAIAGTTGSNENPVVSVGGGGGVSSGSATLDAVYAELKANSQKLDQALRSLGILTSGIQNVLAVGAQHTDDLIAVQNKIADLRAVSNATRRVVEQKSLAPIIETYYKFNSVEIHFLVTNPADVAQTIKFKTQLPSEVRPENILNADNLSIDYDPDMKVYVVSANIALKPRETVIRKVEVVDLWVYPDEKLQAYKDQAAQLIAPLAKTQYEAQGAILTNDIVSTLNALVLRQKTSYSSPQEHIVAYRENAERIVRVESNMEKLKDLVVQSGASRGIVGSIGGIQTFSTWGIVLVLVFGIGMLAAVLFIMWRQQTELAAALGVFSRISKAPSISLGGGQDTNSNSPIPQNQVAIAMILEQQRIARRATWRRLAVGFVITLFVGILTGGIWFAVSKFKKYEIVIENVESKKLLAAVSPTTETTPPTREPKPVSAPVIQRLKILPTPTGWLNLRSTASLQGEVVAKVYPDEEYTYTDSKDGWYLIELPTGERGWVFGTYVTTN